MKFIWFCLGFGGLCVLGSVVGRWLRSRSGQVPYRPLIGPRHMVKGMESPDRRYDAMSTQEAKHRADLVKLAVAGVSPVATPESIELAKAFQRVERRRAGLTDEGRLPESSSRVH